MVAARRSSRFFALILVAAQALSLGHLVLVPHAISPIDGRLLHTTYGSRSAQVEPSAPIRSASLQPAADTAGHASIHCPVADTLRRTPGTRGPTIAAHLDPPAPSQHACPRDLPRIAAGVSLYRLAPKQSPPV
jgi:hypothetical protein